MNRKFSGRMNAQVNKIFLRLIFTVATSIQAANGVEIPERPHDSFAFFINIEVDKVQENLQIFKCGEVYFPHDEKKGEISANIDEALVISLYQVTRKAVQTAKPSNVSVPVIGRSLRVAYDLNGAHVNLSFQEEILEKGIYDKLVLLVREVIKKKNK